MSENIKPRTNPGHVPEIKDCPGNLGWVVTLQSTALANIQPYGQLCAGPLFYSHSQRGSCNISHLSLSLLTHSVYTALTIFIKINSLGLHGKHLDQLAVYSKNQMQHGIYAIFNQLNQCPFSQQKSSFKRQWTNQQKDMVERTERLIVNIGPNG